MRFCEEWNNILYPTEYKEEGVEFGMLVYVCNICKSEVPANPESVEDHCVHQNLSKAGASNIKISKYFTQDPTLSRTKGTLWPVWGYNEVVFFQGNSMSGVNSLASLTYICWKDTCGHSWNHEPSTGQYGEDDDDSD